MANTKISALTAATTPLAGTEVLPIVQSGATVKVATDDLTVRNIRANATTGILQITGPAAASTRVATVPNANWTAARTDAAQSFTGDQTLSTGNLVVSSGKGVDFSAAGGDTLTIYDEGTWTATLFDASTGGNASPTTVTGNYTRIGNVVHCWFRDLNDIVTTGMTGPILYVTLPIAAPASVQSGGTTVLQSFNFGTNSYITPQAISSTSRAWFRITKDSAGANVIGVAGITSGVSDILSFEMTYRV
jgi:hypothetical protein